LQVDPRRDLDQLEPACAGEAEDAALGDVENALPARQRPRAAERTVLDSRHELRACPLPLDRDRAAVDDDLQVACRESADEDHFARRLADVDETAGAGQAAAELADVEIALRVGLR